MSNTRIPALFGVIAALATPSAIDQYMVDACCLEQPLFCAIEDEDGTHFKICPGGVCCLGINAETQSAVWGCCPEHCNFYSTQDGAIHYECVGWPSYWSP